MLNIQLAATAVIQQVLSNGRNLNQALDEALRGKSAWTSAQRAAQTLNIRASGLVNAILRNFLRNLASLLERAVQGEEGRFSYPQWWIDELRAQYGERSAAILDEGNRHPPMALRVNRRRGTAADYLALLAQQDISARLIEDDSIGFGALLLDKPVPVDKLPGFFDGLASVQIGRASC